MQHLIRIFSKKEVFKCQSYHPEYAYTGELLSENMALSDR